MQMRVVLLAMFWFLAWAPAPDPRQPTLVQVKPRDDQPCPEGPSSLDLDDPPLPFESTRKLVLPRLRSLFSNNNKVAPLNPFPGYLDRITADALCTIIFCGYVSLPVVPGFDQSVFEYESDKDKAYEDLQKRLSSIGIKITVKKSVSSEKLPIIYTKSMQSLLESENNRKELAKELVKYIPPATNTEVKLEGTYVGGYIHYVVKDHRRQRQISLVGPSDLATYKPRYRRIIEHNQNQISRSFCLAKKATNTVLDLLKDLKNDTFVDFDGEKVPVNINKLNPKVNFEISDGNLFKSYHGMIVAMCKDPGSVFNFEIAYGPDTKKVSSCFPCATFMTSSRRFPSSTHLGRGDNWNILKVVTTT